MSGEGIARLTPALGYQIAYTLGWKELRPVQVQTIDAVLDGKNCVVLAPTAGGKTESAFFPILSKMDAEDWRPVSTIYLSPIRALLNNQEARVSNLASLVGRRAMKWHGDVDSSARNKFLRNPADILLTTPESLEAILMSQRIPAKELFRGLSAVIIDEVHAFAGDDRGAHLSAVLERLTRFAGRDVQRIGLSATVGNPEEILRWIAGSSQREGVVVDPGGSKKTADISLDFVGAVETAATVIEKLHPGQKRLVFVDSRRRAEEMGKLLSDLGVMTFVTHGSLSVTERQDAERAFAEGSNCVIVSTSALELGIDVGDLDRVLQLEAPATVASFLQRMGRTGRRDGQNPNCTFLCSKDMELLQAAAIIALHRRGWVEPISPPYRAAHIYAHQAMALAIAAGGIGRQDIDGWLRGASAFRDLSAADREGVVARMLEQTILGDQEGRLWLGAEGEKRYGRANFRELYAVFDAPRLIKVEWNGHEVGSVDALFLMTITEDDQKGGCFILGGRSWEVTWFDLDKGKCLVKPAPEGRPARWNGGARFLSYVLCQAMRDLLAGSSDDPAWSKRARERIAGLRQEYAFLAEEPSGLPLVEAKGEILWWTFAGGAANLLIGRMLEAELGEKVPANNFRIKLTGLAATSGVRVRDTLREWARSARPNASDVARFASPAGLKRLSKFEPCLPESEIARLVAERALDAEGARAVLAKAFG